MSASTKPSRKVTNLDKQTASSSTNTKKLVKPHTHVWVVGSIYLSGHGMFRCVNCGKIEYRRI